MLLTPWILLLTALVLAYPLPLILSRALWSVKAPVLALSTWQAVALAGSLSTVGVFLTYGLVPLAESAGDPANLFQLTAAALTLLFSPSGAIVLAAVLGPWRFASIAAAALISFYLFLHLLFSYHKMFQARMKHRNLLDVLATEETVGGDRAQILVIAHETPVAYWFPRRIIRPAPLPIISRGLLDSLSPAQLQAVITHEKTHIKQRHDLLQWAFSAWKSALPWLPTAQKAWVGVVSLIEIVADDRALKTVSAKDLEAVLHYLERRQSAPASFEATSYSMLSYRKTRLGREKRLCPALKFLIGIGDGLLVSVTLLLIVFPTLI